MRGKKHLAQYFLRDGDVAERMVASLSGHGGYQTLVEVGSGTGALTQGLWARTKREGWHLHCVEVDPVCFRVLERKYAGRPGITLISDDFLSWDLGGILKDTQQEEGQGIGVTGNFPYYISGALLRKLWANQEVVQEVVCMLQEEVVRRVVSPPSTRDYGIPSVLLQTYYHAEYLFGVPPQAFHVAPKVNSAVMRLRRNEQRSLPCGDALFARVVKAAFGQRRKKLKNTLSPLMAEGVVQSAAPLLERRPEQLDSRDFLSLIIAKESPAPELSTEPAHKPDRP